MITAPDTLPGAAPVTIDMHWARSASYRDFHAAGVDYLCMSSTPQLVEKLYFIDGVQGDVVVPHEHRYDFDQTVLSGWCENILFEESEDGEEWTEFSYLSPLLGGDGFARKGKAKLRTASATRYVRGSMWTQAAREIHTIRCEPGTILYQRQYADSVGRRPTRAFSKDDALPSIAGLYKPMSEVRIRELAVRLARQGYSVEIVNRAS